MRDSFKIAGQEIEPGSRMALDIPLSLLADHTEMTMPIHVIHGKKEGPTAFVSAAVHGDEINGIEIIRRLIHSSSLRRISGTLILIPIVNTYGFISQSRYLPDRRDLNRSFPGSEKGSLASKLANIFMTEIVERCQYGIDLHTGAIHRSNLPQVRAYIKDDEIKSLATAFGTSVVLHSDLRDGSLRYAAQEVGCNALLYEAGEALRFDERSIRIGMRGVLNVMRHVGILSPRKSRSITIKPSISKSSSWLRAPSGGLFRAYKALGDHVNKGDVLGIVSGPLGETEQEVLAREEGIIIGRTNLPVVNLGDALFNIARVGNLDRLEETTDKLELAIEQEAYRDEEEIIT